MQLFDVRLQTNDDRPESLVMREVYLDFYSKSLKEQETNPDKNAYSVHLQLEQKEHKQILDKIIMGFSPDTYKHEYELDNGDPTKDPSLVVKRQLSKKQKELFGMEVKDEKKTNDGKFKLSTDGLMVEQNKKGEESGADSWRTDKEMDDEEKVANEIMKEQLEGEKSKEAKAIYDKVVEKLSSKDVSKDVPTDIDPKIDDGNEKKKDEASTTT